MLCSVCLATFTNLVKLHRDFHVAEADNPDAYLDDLVKLDYHQSGEAIRAAANLGCFCCLAFWNGLTTNQQDFLLLALPPNSPLAAKLLYTFGSFRNGLQRTFWVPYHARLMEGPSRDNDRYSITFELEVVESTNALSRQPEIVSTTTSSPQSMSVARQWLHICRSSHGICNSSRSSNIKPTRLLDLRSTAGLVRLVDTRDTQCIGPYMTLSHCWGNSRPLRLLRATEAQLRSGISIESLPRAFADAARVCKELGVGYLWIDSLCIRQAEDNIEDDRKAKDDWEVESSLMDLYYTHSLLNISALAAADSSKDFLVDRRPEATNEPLLHLPDASYRVVNVDAWDREVDRQILNTRGWVVQERLLSPRVLHFGKTQLYWQCAHLKAAEARPDGLFRPTFAGDSTPIQASLDLGDLQAQDHGALRYERWHGIVESYSDCKLTYPGDRLIALDGIAKRMGPHLGEYLAGLWRPNLVADLCWHQEYAITAVQERESTEMVYRAPSFSWASVDGPVSFAFDRRIYKEPVSRESMVHIVDCHIEHIAHGGLATGLVKRGWMTLSCQLHKLKVQREVAKPPSTGLGDFIYRGAVGQVNEFQWYIWFDVHEQIADPIGHCQEISGTKVTPRKPWRSMYLV